MRNIGNDLIMKVTYGLAVNRTGRTVVNGADPGAWLRRRQLGREAAFNPHCGFICSPTHLSSQAIM